ncbi:hypothetical protein [Flavobacterium sp. C4GT6]|uniref:hypothetical protein n=1 Tax=Flavobacterium sp. C4GT6 TaxID=3103818 RepID=UPI002ED2BD22
MLSLQQKEILKNILAQLNLINIDLISTHLSNNQKEIFIDTYTLSKKSLKLLIDIEVEFRFSERTYGSLLTVFNRFINFLYYLQANSLDKKERAIPLVSNHELNKHRDALEALFNVLSKIVTIIANGAFDYDNNVFQHYLNIIDGISDGDDVKKIELDQSLRESQQLYKSLEAQVEELRATNKDLIESTRLVTQAAMFNEAAEKNKNESYFWIAMIFVSVGIFIWIIFHLMNNFCFDMACYMPEELKKFNSVCETCGQSVLWLEIIKSIIFRLLIISFALYLVTFCIKNYNAAMHNKTINRHRNNSFAVAFHLFNNTTSKNKDEILSKAADSIFQYQKTGYYGKDNQPINPNVIQNIFDKLSSK